MIINIQMTEWDRVHRESISSAWLPAINTVKQHLCYTVHSWPTIENIMYTVFNNLFPKHETWQILLSLIELNIHGSLHVPNHLPTTFSYYSFETLIWRTINSSQIHNHTAKFYYCVYCVYFLAFLHFTDPSFNQGCIFFTSIFLLSLHIPIWLCFGLWLFVIMTCALCFGLLKIRPILHERQHSKTSFSFHSASI